MGIIGTLHVIFLLLIEVILPLVLALLAIIWVSKIQSISKKLKIILSIIILFYVFVIRHQSDFETMLMLHTIFIMVKDIGQVVLFLFVIIWIRKTEVISKTFKIILIVIISVCVCIMLSNYRDEIIDEKYIERKEMVDNKSLIGLSEEQVVELLGEPGYKFTGRENEENYEYGAGTIREEWFWGRCYSTKYYQLNIWFDENGIVKYAYIKDITDL